MYFKCALGFLIASLVQAGIIFVNESTGISSLNAPFTLTQLLAHIIVGQIAGFLLLFIINRVEAISWANVWAVGAIYGVIVWWIILTITQHLEKSMLYGVKG